MVYLGDNIEFQVIGIGILRVKSFDGSIVTLQDIINVLNLKKILFY